MRNDRANMKKELAAAEAKLKKKTPAPADRAHWGKVASDLKQNLASLAAFEMAPAPEVPTSTETFAESLKRQFGVPRPKSEVKVISPEGEIKIVKESSITHEAEGTGGETPQAIAIEQTREYQLGRLDGRRAMLRTFDPELKDYEALYALALAGLSPARDTPGYRKGFGAGIAEELAARGILPTPKKEVK